jgi:hypothetical protein
MILNQMAASFFCVNPTFYKLINLCVYFTTPAWYEARTHPAAVAVGVEQHTHTQIARGKLQGEKAWIWDGLLLQDEHEFEQEVRDTLTQISIRTLHNR